MRRHQPIRCGLLGLALASLCGICSAATPGPKLVKRFTLPAGASVQALAFGPGGHEAYIARGSELLAYDAATGQMTGTLALPGTVVDIAINPEHATGYALLADPARLASFGLRPLHLLWQQSLGGGTPKAMLYDSKARAVFIEHVHGSGLDKVDATSGRLLGALNLSGTLGQMAIDERGTLYVTDGSNDAIDAVDEAHMSDLGAIPLSACKNPSGLAMDSVGRRLFVGCADGTRAVIDTDMGFTFEHLPSSMRGASRMLFAFHPFGAGGWKGAAIGVAANDRLTLIRMLAFVKYVAAGGDPLPGHCEAMAMDPVTHQPWLAIGGTSDVGKGANKTVELWTLGQAEGARP